jgi:hypothetical protein
MPNTTLGFGFDNGKGGGPSSLSLSLSRYPHPLPSSLRSRLSPRRRKIGLGDGGCERRGSGREVATKATAEDRTRVAPTYRARRRFGPERRASLPAGAEELLSY